MKKKNLLGQKFHRLTVIDFAEPIGPRKRTAWLCRCDCGTIKIVKQDYLQQNHTKSCGCLNNEKRSERARNMYSKNTKFHPMEASARSVWRKRYKDGGLEFGDFLELSQKICEYCGGFQSNSVNIANTDRNSSQYAKDNGKFLYNGLDRIDSNLPHTKENCVPCCKHCNYAKRDRTLEEFKSWIINIYNYFILGEKENQVLDDKNNLCYIKGEQGKIVMKEDLSKNPNLKPIKKKWIGDINFPETNNISNDINNIKIGDLMVWKGNQLSQKYLRTIDEDLRDEIAKDVFNFLKQYNWNELKFEDKDIKTAWNSLCKIQNKLEVIDNITYISNSTTSGNDIYRHYFPNLLKVSSNDRPSIYDGLTNHKMLWDIVRNRIGNTLLYNDDPKGIPVQYPMNLTLSQITIGAKNSGHCSMASIFKPSVAKAIYNKYVKNGDKVLDYSCGFGTRLLGLMSLKKDNLYCGYEPNTTTYANILKMSKDFGFNVEIKCNGSEVGDLFDHKFNFVFSSPPYFDVERYCNEDTQCYVKYPQYTLWLEKYWRETVRNCKNMMTDDGVFSVNIGGNANETMQMMEKDLKRIIEEEGFKLIETWFMKTSKSHLSSKKGKEDKKFKLEGIFFYERIK